MSSYTILMKIPSGNRAGIPGAFSEAASAGPRASRVVSLPVCLFADEERMTRAEQGVVCSDAR